MDTAQLKQKITLAFEATEEIQDPNIKGIAFRVILESLLASSPVPEQKQPPFKQKTVPGMSAADMATGALFLSPETSSEVYGVEGENLFLKIKIEGDTIPEKQKRLTHILLFGYRSLLNVREVPASKLLKVAKDWDIPTTQFARNVKLSEYVQVRNSGKGKNLLLSLKLGSLEGVAEEVKQLLS